MLPGKGACTVVGFCLNISCSALDPASAAVPNAALVATTAQPPKSSANEK